MGTLWHTLAKLDELHLSILQSPTNLCKLQAKRTRQDVLSPGPPATIHPHETQPQSTRHPAVITLTVTHVSTWPYVQHSVVFLVVVVVSGHPQPSWRTRHPCTVDVLLGVTGVI